MLLQLSLFFSVCHNRDLSQNGYIYNNLFHLLVAYYDSSFTPNVVAKL